MGKGKGSFARWSIKLRPMLCFMEFFGFHPSLLKRILIKSSHWFTSKPSLCIRQFRFPAWSDNKWQVFLNNQASVRLV